MQAEELGVVAVDVDPEVGAESGLLTGNDGRAKSLRGCGVRDQAAVEAAEALQGEAGLVDVECGRLSATIREGLGVSPPGAIRIVSPGLAALIASWMWA